MLPSLSPNGRKKLAGSSSKILLSAGKAEQGDGSCLKQRKQEMNEDSKGQPLSDLTLVSLPNMSAGAEQAGGGLQVREHVVGICYTKHIQPSMSSGQGASKEACKLQG
eukprot:scaffold107799_cov21-Tisochrysis_lutea.AAC.5